MYFYDWFLPVQKMISCDVQPVITKVMASWVLCFDKDGSIKQSKSVVASRKIPRCLSPKITSCLLESFPMKIYERSDSRQRRAQQSEPSLEKEIENNAVCKSLRSGSLAKLGHFCESGVVGVYWKAAIFCCSAC